MKIIDKINIYVVTITKAALGENVLVSTDRLTAPVIKFAIVKNSRPL